MRRSRRRAASPRGRVPGCPPHRVSRGLHSRVPRGLSFARGGQPQPRRAPHLAKPIGPMPSTCRARPPGHSARRPARQCLSGDRRHRAGQLLQPRHLYCTLLYFGPAGGCWDAPEAQATAAERLIWARGMVARSRSWRRSSQVGGLICWENYMPLARMAMYGKGVDIYLAPTADARETWQATLRHIACEGRCFVLGVISSSTKSMYPADLVGARIWPASLRSCAAAAAPSSRRWDAAGRPAVRPRGHPDGRPGHGEIRAAGSISTSRATTRAPSVPAHGQRATRTVNHLHH